VEAFVGMMERDPPSALESQRFEPRIASSPAGEHTG